jgi:hypothetical protein
MHSTRPINGYEGAAADDDDDDGDDDPDEVQHDDDDDGNNLPSLGRNFLGRFLSTGELFSLSVFHPVEAAVSISDAPP